MSLKRALTLTTCLALSACEGVIMLPEGHVDTPHTPGDPLPDGGRGDWFSCAPGSDPSAEVVLRLAEARSGAQVCDPQCVAVSFVSIGVHSWFSNS